MTDKFAPLVPVKDGAPLWLFTIGTDVYLDLNEYTSRDEWEDRRGIPLRKWYTRFRRADHALSFVATPMLAISLFWQDGAPEWLFTAAVVLTVVSVLFVVHAFLCLRNARSNMVVVPRWRRLHSELRLLAMALTISSDLKVDKGIEVELPDNRLEQLNPDALADMARGMLQLRFPRIDANYVQEVRTDITDSLHKTTGVKLTAD